MPVYRAAPDSCVRRGSRWLQSASPFLMIIGHRPGPSGVHLREVVGVINEWRCRGWISRYTVMAYSAHFKNLFEIVMSEHQLAPDFVRRNIIQPERCRLPSAFLSGGVSEFMT